MLEVLHSYKGGKVCFVSHLFTNIWLLSPCRLIHGTYVCYIPSGLIQILAQKLSVQAVSAVVALGSLGCSRVEVP